MLWEFFFQFLVEDETYYSAQHLVRKVLDESRSIDAEDSVVYGRKECLRYCVGLWKSCQCAIDFVCYDVSKNSVGNCRKKSSPQKRVY